METTAKPQTEEEQRILDAKLAKETLLRFLTASNIKDIYSFISKALSLASTYKHYGKKDRLEIQREYEAMTLLLDRALALKEAEAWVQCFDRLESEKREDNVFI